MKLKMRFESKYMIRFGIFALVLFILVSIGISNLVCFSSMGYFCGFSFYYAFQTEYIGTTLVVYLITLIGLVASCKSFFFEMDKGFGFTTEKKMDGYSNWCDKKKMKSELKPVVASNIKANAGGIPLINDDLLVGGGDGGGHAVGFLLRMGGVEEILLAVPAQDDAGNGAVEGNIGDGNCCGGTDHGGDFRGAVTVNGQNLAGDDNIVAEV